MYQALCGSTMNKRTHGPCVFASLWYHWENSSQAFSEISIPVITLSYVDESPDDSSNTLFSWIVHCFLYFLKSRDLQLLPWPQPGSCQHTELFDFWTESSTTTPLTECLKPSILKHFWTHLSFNLSLLSWFHFLLNLTHLDAYHIHYFLASPVPWIATIYWAPTLCDFGCII